MEISRRGFLGGTTALVAGMLVPTLRLRSEVDLHRLVAMWCDQEEAISRYSLDLPFVVDGMSYASDGRGMARVETLDDDTSDKLRKLPDAIACYDRFWRDSGRWQRLPEENLIRHPSCRCVPCPQCREDGSLIECPQCFEGSIELDRSPWIDACPLCKGCGELSNGACEVCSGTTYGDYETLQPIGDQLFDVYYVHKLVAIPDVRWCRGNIVQSIGQPILFRSDVGIDGILMPVRPQ